MHAGARGAEKKNSKKIQKKFNTTQSSATPFRGVYAGRKQKPKPKKKRGGAEIGPEFQPGGVAECECGPLRRVPSPQGPSPGSHSGPRPPFGAARPCFGPGPRNQSQGPEISARFCTSKAAGFAVEGGCAVVIAARTGRCCFGLGSRV
eukprot:934496-Rhodomonas_salina.1